MGHLFRMALLPSIFLSATSFAAHPIFHPIGPALTQGKVSSKHNLSSSLHNPASAPLMFDGEKNDRWRFGIFGPLGAGYEVGQVDDLLDELDELIDILDDNNLSVDDALDAKDRFEPFLQNAESDGYVKASAAGFIPAFPILYQHPEWGTFSFGLSASGEVKGAVLADEIDVLVLPDGYELNTNASMYLKSAGQVNFAVGYSRSVWESVYGDIIAGARLKVTTMELSKSVLSFSALDSDEDIIDVIEDEYERNSRSSTELGVDVGLLWVASDYQLGLTITDVNEPEFEYGDLRSNCQQSTGAGIGNCFAAQEFLTAGKIKGQEVYVANRQATVEGSAFFTERNQLGVHLTVDLNDKNDPLGDPYQFTTVSVSYNTDNWYFPQLRAGYSRNSKGTELSYYTFGMTMFKNLYLDVRWSDENTQVDESSIPRSAFINLGFQSRF